MKFESDSLNILAAALERLGEGFASLPESAGEVDSGAIKDVLMQVADRMQDNYPYFHPLYAGQMLKPPHVMARLAYMLSLWINPNNHALDGGRASSRMEKEAVAALADIFGWETYMGHLCSGGTMANLEALWVSSKLQPGQLILASEQAHYTHSRISEVLSLNFRTIPCDNRGRMDIRSLEKLLRQGNVGTVVATMGTTGVGAVDPLQEILELRDKYEFRIHADAAYGGYFVLADNLEVATRRNLDCLRNADSLVIDPHKHGLQPYGCGCILFKNPSVGAFYKHDSPYTYFSSAELHLGEISLECSRPGASAVALWATQKLLPMVEKGAFASSLANSRRAAVALFEKLRGDSRFLTIMPPELDIVVWAIRAKKASQISRLSRKIFDLAAQQELHLAVLNYSSDALRNIWEDVEFDGDNTLCLRSCLMKAEHLDWIDRIWQILMSAMQHM
jgi:tyrosine decarboxylase/aspartate 1-decarboxylase